MHAHLHVYTCIVFSYPLRQIEFASHARISPLETRALGGHKHGSTVRALQSTSWEFSSPELGVLFFGSSQGSGNPERLIQDAAFKVFRP